MILVTVGSQMPFDRLVGAVDGWAAGRGADCLLAQIGPGGRRPRHMPWAEFLAPEVYRDHVRQARVIVSHAGMGSILTALELGKTILVMPRRASLYETRNDHQVATARQLQSEGQIHVAYNEAELVDRLATLDKLEPSAPISPIANASLIAALQRFICEIPQPAADVAPQPASRWQRFLGLLSGPAKESVPLTPQSTRQPPT